MTLVPRTSAELLRDVPVLGELPGPELKVLAAAVELREAARGEALFSEGQMAEGLFVIRTGEVKVVKTSKEGREQILYLARSGRAITEGLRFDGRRYPATATAMRTTTALLMPNSKIAEIGSQHPTILRCMVDMRARRADRHLALIGDLALRTVPARLASFLCTLVAARQARGDTSMTLVRDLTTETVAARLGTVREEISRSLTLLEREGVLRVSPDVVEIQDLVRLEQFAYGAKGSRTSAVTERNH